MDFIAINIPTWVSAAFLLVIFIPTLLIANIAKKAAQASPEIKKPNQVFFTIIIFYLIYFIYVGIACQQGAFAELGLPPRVMVLSAVPLLLFLVLVVSNLSVYKNILANLDLADLVKLHLFRLIGSFFIILMIYDQLPPVFALIAGIGDITTAITSIFVARAIRQNKSYAKPLTIAWNTFGLVDILITAVMAFVLTKLSMEDGIQRIEILALFPFCFIPAFAPATIIFLHIMNYRKVLMK